MEKSKNIKTAVGVVIGVFAIIYYFVNNSKVSSYENLESDNSIVTSTVNEVNNEETLSKIKVYVTGEVNNPGVIELEEGGRIEDAIEGCGGITAQANLKDINLAYEVSDGEKIYIPNLSEDIETEKVETTESSSSSSSSSSNNKININKATVSELTSIPGIGESTAQRIIDYRDENGKFKSVEDIKNVSGIGDSKYQKMKDYISVK